MIRVADYIAQKIYDAGVDSVFMVSGGMMMHLIDAVGRVPKLRYYCNHHEQCSTIAAETYARVHGPFGVCFATSGPGGSNTLTGIAGAWVDSTPMLVLVGQTKTANTVRGSGITGLRSYGPFELDFTALAQPITKYAAFVDDPKTIRYHMEKALYYAQAGRPGPVALEIPLDVQGALIDPDTLEGFNPIENIPYANTDQVADVASRLAKADRPLVLAGNGIRLAGAKDRFLNWIHQAALPFVTTQMGKDLTSYDDPLWVGHVGIRGDRAANYAVQHADLILIAGCGLNIQNTGYELDLFAPQAVKILVDVDQAMLSKDGIAIDIRINSDIKSFFDAMPPVQLATQVVSWQKTCVELKERWMIKNEPHYRSKDDLINYYDFVEILSESLSGGEIIVTDAGSAYYIMGQAFRLKEGQRFIASGALGSMGWALPGATGAAVGAEKTVICVTGDGSLHMNIHELQVLRHYGLNIKVFVVNNQGYLSIRNTQNAYFDGHLVGSSEDSGVSLPDWADIAETYGIEYQRADRADQLSATISSVLAMPGPVLCEIVSQPDQKLIPAVQSRKLPDGRMISNPLDMMDPPLPSNGGH